MKQNNTFYSKLGKRLFDLVLTIPGILLISPALIVLALLIRFRLGSPVFFKQIRPGLNGKPFTICKFRTMTDVRDEKGNQLPDEKRLTRLGLILRGASLDELPELWNVLKGEMSLVGPRPLKMDYLTLYTTEQARRHEVRPGVTGWAQINGRNELDWEQRFKLDYWYVCNSSLWLDIKIILTTFLKVYKKEGASPEGGSSILKPFRGNGVKYIDKKK